MTYLEKHQKSGLKIGDQVYLYAAAQSFQEGWNNEWIDAMDTYIGRVGVITKDLEENGFCIDFGDREEFAYPYFVLKE